MFHLSHEVAARPGLTQFYDAYPYPWPARRFALPSDPDLYCLLLNQDIGAWTDWVIQPDCSIWVAGCGTNQAVETASRFPRARVVASDIALSSLRVAEASARDLEISNLELRHENIAETAYREEFDYVICTGVIHHTHGSMSTVLERLASSLTQQGVLELMVYNLYHRTDIAALRRVAEILFAESKEFPDSLRICERLLTVCSENRWLPGATAALEHLPSVAVADALLSPVEQSLTVSTLERLLNQQGLRLVIPCMNVFDAASDVLEWTIDFQDPELTDLCSRLSDVDRWELVNHTLGRHSPMIWFFACNHSARWGRTSEREIGERFLNTIFARVESSQDIFVRSPGGSYFREGVSVPLPSGRPLRGLCQVWSEADGVRTMETILRDVVGNVDARRVNGFRAGLATTTFPFLRAVQTCGSCK